MKKVLFSALIMSALLWNYAAVFAQGEGEGRKAGGQNRNIREAVRARQTDPNDLRRRAAEMRLKNQEPQVPRDKRREELMRLREKRRAQMEEAGRRRDANRPEIMLRKGQDHQQQLKALEEQRARVEAKHMERVAQLERIKALASEEGSKETVARVEKLMQKEQRNYSLKKQRMEMRMRMLSRMQGRKENAGLPDAVRSGEERPKSGSRGYTRRSRGEVKGKEEGTGEEGGK
ncbi:MAG TPA: hypothetical protein VMW16_02530 [Sedimentisphaerales bacterium]|nr:hypothetical protein [Sedimentisphaerales bacterium]